MPVFTDEYAPVDTFLSPLDSQPYTLETWWQQTGELPAQDSALTGATLGALAIAGVWAVHLRGVWRPQSP
ncbi:hypothetical protein [Candidatus Nitrososphaera sp. FF02]|uniref:hypothetical protein n=1 Tax=Candidatus Nitrososphaera sp. FF02 TaxID=3398226 RepID=UPI0039EAFF0A